MYKFFLKRVIDILGSLFLLVLLFPINLAISLFVFLFIGRPVLFRQERAGIHGKIFYIYKFKTMNDKKDRDGKFLPDEERITKLGQFLRKSSLDELPGLINVLKGEMSFVGPRPLFSSYLPLYTSEQSRRHDVRPGITGWAQVNGRNAISWEKKFELDVWYVRNESFLVDVKIILLTMYKVLRRKDISEKGCATMSVFKGSPKR